MRILYSCLAYVQADMLLITVPPEKYLAAPNMVPHISLSHTSVCQWPTCQSTIMPANPWPKLLHNDYICSNYLPSMYITPPKKTRSLFMTHPDIVCVLIYCTQLNSAVANKLGIEKGFISNHIVNIINRLSILCHLHSITNCHTRITHFYYPHSSKLT